MHATKIERRAQLAADLGALQAELYTMHPNKLGTAWHADRCDAVRALQGRLDALDAAIAAERTIPQSSPMAEPASSTLYTLDDNGEFTPDNGHSAAVEMARTLPASDPDMDAEVAPMAEPAADRIAKIKGRMARIEADQAEATANGDAYAIAVLLAGWFKLRRELDSLGWAW